MVVKKTKKEFASNFMTFLWMSYSTGLLLFEYKGWRVMPYSLMYILLYPLLLKEKAENDVK